MNSSCELYILDVMSGRAPGLTASALRTLLRAAEPFYATAVRARNKLYDAGLIRHHVLDRPVISIGNITTGGTGKTPVVRWIAEQLRKEGMRPAILSRGYRAKGGELGDELMMLDRLLNRPGAEPIILRADADRVRAGKSLLHEHPEIDVILLDDGFQHRRIGRDFDLVLVSAMEPFGFGHVLPRGLLREPMAGLNRAQAIVMTHADQANEQATKEIESAIRKYNSVAPIYRAVHAQTGLIRSEAPTEVWPIEELTEKRFFSFCGIGKPASFEASLQQFGNNFAGHKRFGDHHEYIPVEIKELTRQARNLGADVLLTTEKDWVKIEHMACDMPIWRVAMRVQFPGDDQERLLALIRRSISRRSAQ